MRKSLKVIVQSNSISFFAINSDGVLLALRVANVSLDQKVPHLTSKTANIDWVQPPTTGRYLLSHFGYFCMKINKMIGETNGNTDSEH